jgi:hypothetical protein
VPHELVVRHCLTACPRCLCPRCLAGRAEKRQMLLLAALTALALQGGAQLPSSLLEAPQPTAPSASCAPGVPANQCLAAPAADGSDDDEHAAAQLLLSLDELIFFVRDAGSFAADGEAARRYLPVVHAVLEEVQELTMITTIEQLEEEVLPPSVTSHLIFKHWCRLELPPGAAPTLCPRYLERLKKSEDGVWQTVHEQLQPVVAFLSRLLDVWTIRFKRQRTQQQGGGDGNTRPALRVVVNGAGPAGLINAVTAYTAGAEVVVLEKRPLYEVREKTQRDTMFLALLSDRQTREHLPRQAQDKCVKD